MRLGLKLLVLVYLAGLAAYFVAFTLGLAQAGWLGFIRELTLYLFLPLPALLLAALLLRAPDTLALLVLPLTLFAYFYGPQFLPRARAESQSSSFRVMTFNAGGNEGGGQAEPLLRLLQSERVDVVALQEVRRSTLEMLGMSLHTEYPYQFGTPDAAVLSRFPLVNASEFRLYSEGYLSQQLDVEISGQLIRLTNVHVRRPASGLSLRRVLTWARQYDADWRDIQVETLMSRIRSVEGPQLLTGDFNQTEWSPSYPLVSAELLDSFREGGWGFGHTFPSNLAWARWNVALPLLRIDYIFHSRELITRAARIGPESSSVHLPVIVDLAFR